MLVFIFFDLPHNTTKLLDGFARGSLKNDQDFLDGSKISNPKAFRHNAFRQFSLFLNQSCVYIYISD